MCLQRRRGDGRERRRLLEPHRRPSLVKPTRLARLTLGVELWAVVYHFWLPFNVWLFHDTLHLRTSR